MSETHDAPELSVQARELAAALEADATLRLDVAYEMLVGRETLGALRTELATERRRLEASVRAMAGQPRGARSEFARLVPWLSCFVAGMVVFALLTWVLETVAPRGTGGSCLPVAEGAR